MPTAHRNPLGLYHRILQAVLMRVRPAPVAVWIKKLLGVSRLNVETQQGIFFIDPVSLLGIALSQRDCYEPNMCSTLKQFLGPGKTFVDLGANEGYFTVIGARLCQPQGRVIAIEPQRRLLPVIEENLRLNGLSNVSLVNAAVTDTPGQLTLHLTSDTNSGGSGLHRHAKYSLPTQEVTAMTLAQVLDQQKVDHVDLMKVDIEGFEYEALLGSPEVFQRHRIRALALELHPTILADRGKCSSDIEQMLTSAGYRLTEAFGNSVWVAQI